jgi:hypothetical protein
MKVSGAARPRPVCHGAAVKPSAQLSAAEAENAFLVSSAVVVPSVFRVQMLLESHNSVIRGSEWHDVSCLGILDALNTHTAPLYKQ